MQAPTPQPSTLRSIFRQWATDGIGVIVAAMLGGVVILMVIIATAQSAKPWDTFIAALAMMSQAFFAYIVFRLSKQQYEFTKKIAERQQKIEMFGLRKEAANRLEQAGRAIIPFGALSYLEAAKFIGIKLEISQIFSVEASDLAYELHDSLEEAVYLFGEAKAEYIGAEDRMSPTDPVKYAKALETVEDASSILSRLQRRLNDEMRIT